MKISACLATGIVALGLSACHAPGERVRGDRGAFARPAGVPEPAVFHAGRALVGWAPQERGPVEVTVSPSEDLQFDIRSPREGDRVVGDTIDLDLDLVFSTDSRLLRRATVDETEIYHYRDPKRTRIRKRLPIEIPGLPISDAPITITVWLWDREEPVRAVITLPSIEPEEPETEPEPEVVVPLVPEEPIVLSRPGVEARVGALLLALRSDVRTGPEGVRGTKLRMEEDLDLPGQAVLPTFEVKVGSDLRVEVEALHSRREGEDVVAFPVFYNGELVGVPGDTVAARSETLFADIRLSKTVHDSDRSRVDLMLGAKYFRVEHVVKNRETTLDPLVTARQTEDTMEIPALYVGAGGRFALGSSLSGTSRLLFTHFGRSPIDDSAITYLDFSLGLGYLVAEPLGLSLEYRFLRVDLEEEGDDFTSRYDMLGAGLGLFATLQF